MDLRTGDPFWPIRAGLLRSYPPVRSHLSAEVVVIGAGITGALVARALAKEGADVIVVDRHDVGMGSSAASTGLLQYACDTALTDLIPLLGEQAAVSVYRMGVEAIDTIASLCRELDDSCGFARRPSLYLASGVSSVGLLAREYAIQHRHGFDVTLLDRPAIEGAFSFSAAGGLYCGGDAEVDCYRLVHALIADAVSRGARVFDRTAILSARTSRSGVVLETDRGHRITAGTLVIAAGYQTEEEIVRTQATLNSTWVFASEPLESFAGWPDRCLIWETAQPYFYLRTTPDRRVIAGGRDAWSRSRHESQYQLKRQTEALADRVRRMFPALGVEIAYRWAGVFATTPDSLPLIGQRPEFPNTWFALGYGGNGITFSVMAAAIVRDAYLGLRHPATDTFAFDRPTLSSRRWLRRRA